MELENEKGIFELEGKSTIDIELTNPLFNEEGSRSLPFNIKLTKHNEWLLDYPNSYERKKQYTVRQPVNIRSGVFNENATLELLDSDTPQAECVLYLYESTFYSQVKKIKLSAVFEGIERWFQPDTVPREERVDYIIDLLEGMIREQPNHNVDDFSIFPAVIECDLNTGSIMGTTGASAYPQNLMNQVIEVHQGDNVSYNLKARNSYSYEDSSGNIITVPRGYGISPFLKFSYVLRKTFEYFGFTLEENIFDTHPNYSHWCVLNNTMDAILPGYFIESQLVPNCTVNDLLDVIREGLCADFFIDVFKKTARLVLFNDVLDAEPDMDLTPYVRYQKQTLAIPKQLRLTIDRGLPLADIATSTIEDFKRKFPDYNPNPDFFPGEGINAYNEQNSIWRIYDPVPGWIWTLYKIDRLTSMNFDYDTDNDLEREEHKIPMEALATVYVNAKSRDAGDTEALYGARAPVIGSKRHLNSFVILDTGKQLEEEIECPIMISEERYTGVVRDGLQWESLLLWNDRGLQTNFWSRYEELLKTSFNDLTFTGRIPIYLLNNFRFDRQKSINGQPLIPISLKYKLESKDEVNIELLCKTVKPYE